jgi:hypothetical protein
VAGCLEHRDQYSVDTKREESLEYTSSYSLVRKGFDVGSCCLDNVSALLMANKHKTDSH